VKRLCAPGFIVAAFVLAACQVQIDKGPGPDGPWETATEVTAVADPTTAVRSGDSVAGNDPRYYVVNIPAALSQPLVYIELANVSGGEAIVEVFTAARPRVSAIASRSPAWFGATDAVLALADDELEAVDLEAQFVTINCRGPCVILDNVFAGEEASVYVRVNTTGTGTVRYDLHAFDDAYGDPGEPPVSDCQDFPSLSLQAPSSGAVFEPTGAGSPNPILEPDSITVEPEPGFLYRGALETLDDIDCYVTAVGVNRVELTTAADNAGIFIRAEIFDAETNAPLDVIGVTPGDRVSASGPLDNRPVKIRVYSSNRRAGPSATSWYELGFPEAPPPEPPPPPDDPWDTATEVTAIADPNIAVRSGDTVTAASPRYYQITLPAALNEPLVYIELANVSGGEAIVEVFTAARPRVSAIASRTAEWFGVTGQVLALDDDELEPVDLEAQFVTVNCRGPCVILERTVVGEAANVYVRVSTTGTGTITYELHAFDDPYGDPGEPQVSDCQDFPALSVASLDMTSLLEPIGPAVAGPSPSSIIVEPIAGRYRGALETVGDVDCYLTATGVDRVELTTAADNAGIFIRAEIFDAETNAALDIIGVTPGNRVSVSGPLGNRPVKIRVYASNERAGPSANSWYELDF
jgi:hypothetical protein